jgi:hypothetical protein
MAKESCPSVSGRMAALVLVLLGSEVAAQSANVTDCESTEGWLTCSVANSGNVAFRSLRYVIVARETGRTFPWGETSGVIEIPGGLEPGEAVDLEFRLPELPQRALGRDVRFVASASPKREMADADDAARLAMCWNPGSLSREAMRETVLISYSVGVDGRPDLLAMEGTFSETNAGQQAFEAARRAIIRCGASGGLTGGTVEFSGVTGVRVVE